MTTSEADRRVYSDATMWTETGRFERTELLTAEDGVVIAQFGPDHQPDRTFAETYVTAISIDMDEADAPKGTPAAVYFANRRVAGIAEIIGEDSGGTPENWVEGVGVIRLPGGWLRIVGTAPEGRARLLDVTPGTWRCIRWDGDEP